MEKIIKYKYLVHTDGGSRGNPGPSAAGVVIESVESDGRPARLRREVGEYLGEVTNNEAEYRAVILALKKLKHLVGGDKAKNSSVEIHLDAELLERQLNGQYKIKDENIKRFFLEIWNLKTEFGEVIFKHIPREENTDADRVVNQILDQEGSKLKL